MPEVETEDTVDGFPHNSSDDQLYRGPGDHLRYEQYRLDTFINWPSTASVDKIALAQNGFYYLGDGDRVKCAFCNIILKRWDPGDDVKKEHKKHAPHCPFLNDPESVGNIPHRQFVRSTSRLEAPKHVEYKNREIRLKSFTKWPSDRKQTPADLACAGFFYTGSGDAVKCFYCGGMLKYWDDPDVPWEEHKRWFPACPFVLENDVICQQELCKKRRNSIVRIAEQNHYPKELLEYHRKYFEENGLPYPDNYEDLVDQLENLKIQQESSGATGYTQTQNQAISSGGTAVTHPVEKQEEKERKRKNRKSVISQILDTDERFQCKICMEKHVEVIFLPCRHVCCCQACNNKLRVNECPICRAKIKAAQPLYFA